MATVTEKETYEILDGPSKFDLMLALFDLEPGRGAHPSRGRTVLFQLRRNSDFTILAVVQSVMVGVALGEHWKICITEVDRPGAPPPKMLFGTYSTITRRGDLACPKQ